MKKKILIALIAMSACDAPEKTDGAEFRSSTPTCNNVSAAVGDGVTNDTVAIQNALDNSDAVCLGSGTYLVDKLTIDTPVKFGGEGPGATVLLMTDQDNVGILIDDTWRNGSEQDGETYPGGLDDTRARVQIFDLALVGDSEVSKSQDGIATYDRVDDLLIDNVHMLGMHGTCLSLGERGTLGLVRESMFRGVHMRECGQTGVIISTGPTAGDMTNQLRFEDLRVIHPHGDGVRIVNTRNDPMRRLDFAQTMLHGGTESANMFHVQGDVQSGKLSGFVNGIYGSTTRGVLFEDDNTSGESPSHWTLDLDIRALSWTGIRLQDDTARVQVRGTMEVGSIDGGTGDVFSVGADVRSVGWLVPFVPSSRVNWGSTAARNSSFTWSLTTP